MVPEPGAIDSKTFRGINKVKIEVTNSLPYFNFVDLKAPDLDKMIELKNPVQARYARITIQAQPNDDGYSAIGVHQ